MYTKNFGSSTTNQQWLPGRITDCTGLLSYKIILDDGSSIHRHIDHIRPRTDSTVITPDLPDMDQGDSTSNTSPVIIEEDSNETVDYPELTPDTDSAETSCGYPTGNHRPPDFLGPMVSH